MDKQSLEVLLAQGESVERIAKRFGKDPSTVSYWMRKYGLTSPYAEKHAARGGIERTVLEELVTAGASITRIAKPCSAVPQRSGTGSRGTTSRRSRLCSDVRQKRPVRLEYRSSSARVDVTGSLISGLKGAEHIAACAVDRSTSRVGGGGS